MKALKSFVERSNVAPTLIRAVVRQIGGWDDFKEAARDVAEHGADAGFSGFTYYSDTVAFYAKNQSEVVIMAGYMANEFGIDPVALVRGFNCLHGATEDEVGRTLYGSISKHATQVANALAWFALEEVARSYVDICEE